MSEKEPQPLDAYFRDKTSGADLEQAQEIDPDLVSRFAHASTDEIPLLIQEITERYTLGSAAWEILNDYRETIQQKEK